MSPPGDLRWNNRDAEIFPRGLCVEGGRVGGEGILYYIPGVLYISIHSCYLHAMGSHFPRGFHVLTTEGTAQKLFLSWFEHDEVVSFPHVSRRGWAVDVPYWRMRGKVSRLAVFEGPPLSTVQPKAFSLSTNAPSMLQSRGFRSVLVVFLQNSDSQGIDFEVIYL